jgi:O-antigen/teichoic acid export membrane protein
LVSKVLGFLAFAYLARATGAAAYGSIEFAASLASFFGMIIDGGLDAIGVREAHRSPDRVPDLAARIPAIRLLITLAALPLLGGVAWAAGESFETTILAWMFGLSLFAAPWKQVWLLQSRSKMLGVAVGDVLQMFVLYAGVRFLVHSREDLLWLGAVQMASMLGIAAYYLAYQQRYIAPIRLRWSIAETGQLIRSGLPIGLANMVWAFHQYLPVVLMIAIAGAEATGYFGASHRLVLSLLTFSYVYHFNLFPEMARRAATSAEGLDSLLRSSFRVVAWCGCGLALVLTISARPILTVLYGTSFAESAPSLAVMSWILPITILGGHARWTLISVGHQRFVFWSQAAGVLTMLVSGPILIAWFGVVGASVAMVLACLAVWLVAHICAVSWVGHAPPLAIAALPVGLSAAVFLVTELLNVPIPLRLAAVALLFVVFGPLIDGQLFSSIRVLSRSKNSEHDTF